MPKKSKPKTKPLRGATLIRHMFAAPKATFTIDEIVAKLGYKSKTPKASACAILSVLGNADKTENPIKISLDRETKKYSLQPGWEPSPRDLPCGAAAPKAKKAGKKKVAKPGKRKAKPKGDANGPVVAAAA